MKALAGAVAAGFVVVSGSGAAYGQVRLPHMLGDHAVVQRDRPIHLWGWAAPGSRLSATLHGRRAEAVADRIGRWDAWFAPERAGGPYEIAITADGGQAGVTLHDVMVGDVWFASGQSNMEMPLSGFPPSAHVRNAEAEIAAATNPRLRLLRVEHAASAFPLHDADGAWTTCTPETAAKFSAVGYFFAREIAAREHVTVGVIDSTWGGTPADSWVSTEGLAADPALLPAFAARARFAAGLADRDATAAANDRDDAEAKAKGLPAPKHDWLPDERSWTPAALYNAMVAPFTPYGLKGVIWYQGETNSDPRRAPDYEALFKGLIVDWRHQFAQGDTPFLFAQISSFDSPGETWAIVRDAQRRALGLASTAMAVTTDVGDPANVHPSDKQTVGARLALGARAVAYGERVAYASPLYRQTSSEPGALRVWFDNGEGLTTHGAALTGFEVAGSDRHYAPAEARIEGDSVRVASTAVTRPVFVRYNWAGVTTGAFYNAAGLPASTFTSEEHILSTPSFP